MGVAMFVCRDLEAKLCQHKCLTDYEPNSLLHPSIKSLFSIIYWELEYTVLKIGSVSVDRARSYITDIQIKGILGK